MTQPEPAKRPYWYGRCSDGEAFSGSGGPAALIAGRPIDWLTLQFAEKECRADLKRRVVSVGGNDLVWSLSTEPVVSVTPIAFTRNTCIKKPGSNQATNHGVLFVGIGFNVKYKSGRSTAVYGAIYPNGTISGELE